MSFYTPNQTSVIISLIVLGVLFGILYDFLSVKRCFIKQGAVWLFIEDFCFSLLFCLCFIIVIFLTNYGYIRWYEFVFGAFGFFLYRFSVGEAVFALLKILVSALLKFVSLMYKSILVPIRFVLRISEKLADKLMIMVMGYYAYLYSEYSKQRNLKSAKSGFADIK